MNYMDLFYDLETIQAFETDYTKELLEKNCTDDEEEPLEVNRNTMIHMLSLVQRYKQIIYMLAGRRIDEVIKPNKF